MTFLAFLLGFMLAQALTAAACMWATSSDARLLWSVELLRKLFGTERI